MVNPEESTAPEMVGTVIGTIAGLAVDMVVTYYILQPERLQEHSEILRSHWHRFRHWLSVQQTLASIRNLPETRNSCNT